MKREIVMYVTNHVVARIPFHSVRLAFYRYVLDFKIGRSSSILMGAWFDYFRDLRIGEHSVVNQRCRLDSRGGISVGNNVSISANVTILSADHDVKAPAFTYRERSVVIDDYAFIGTGSIILPGVSIGRGAVVAAGSVVPRSVPPLAIVAGNPAKVVGQRPSSALDYTLAYRPPLH
jgi:acetyltransferase-like isoleucine patch superfamily enzyme